MNNIIIGSHVSFLKDSELYGSVMESVSYGANTFMIYTGSNQSAERREINHSLTLKGWEAMKEHGIDINNVIVHAPFIVNLANNKDERKYNFYISFMKNEINRCKELGIHKMVFHPGSRTDLDKEVALDNIVFGLNSIMKDVNDFDLLIEFMSGKGTEVGCTIEDMKYIMDNINVDNVGVCLDTCHINDAGYDISEFDSFLDLFDKYIGINKIKCVHVNDSLNPLGSHKDRHANIGYGTIGFEAIINVIYNERLKGIPMILETPYVNEKAPYKYEIDNIRNKKFIDYKVNL
jgi:deoxyribonuclease-4